MTREEAIDLLDNLIGMVEDNHESDYDTALKMGIKALEQEPCEDEYIKVPKKALKYRTTGMVAYNAEWLKNHFDIERAVICGEQEPCEDAISRQDVISRDEVCNYIAEFINHEYSTDAECEMVDLMIKGIQHMPSVKPQEPKTGHWEWVQYDSNPNIGNWHCSECRTIIPHMPEETDNTPIYKWCPMCGARMD